MEYEEFIQFFTHEVNYNLKMLGVPWLSMRTQAAEKKFWW